MKQFDKLYDLASDNYGIVTKRDANDCGVTREQLHRMVKQGLLERRGYGVYKLNKYQTPTEFDRYAEAVALVGEGAFVYGESVLAMLNLGLVNPPVIEISSPNRRVRRTLPKWIQLRTADPSERRESIEGIPCQPLYDAILDCRKCVMTDRLIASVEKGAQGCYLNQSEKDRLLEELNKEMPK